jgi:hypothetical protein
MTGLAKSFNQINITTRRVIQMTFNTKQNAGLLKSARSWGALGLILALAVVTVGYGPHNASLGLATVAQQTQPAQPVTEIKIVPEKPTPNDEIKIELSGTFPNTCAPETDSAKVTVEHNQVTVATSNASEFCNEAVTRWSLSVPVGKKLAAGPYRVLVLFRMTKEPPDLLLGMARFDVAEKSANTDQARQTALVPLTILPLVQTLDNSPWLPSGRHNAVTVKGKKSNSDNRVALPGTTSTEVGEEVTVTLNLKELEKSGFQYSHCDREGSQGLTFGKEVPCKRPPPCPPHCPEEYTIAIQITGTDPILKLSFEQTELPDLAVDIRANVRSYREREQVFCDITVVTTVSNTAKGSAGGVVVLGKYNNSRSNIQRVGMSPGGQATKVDFESRLRPGVYSYEAEVKSLSIKESNTANNKAMQVVTCR